jgi:hypothetical protein
MCFSRLVILRAEKGQGLQGQRKEGMIDEDEEDEEQGIEDDKPKGMGREDGKSKEERHEDEEGQGIEEDVTEEDGTQGL